MWSKKVIAVLLVLLLSGCAKAETMEKQIRFALNQAKEDPYPAINQQKQYYGYYLPPDIGRRKSTLFSEVLVKDGYTIVMNFKSRAVIEAATSSSQREAQEVEQEVLKELLGHASYETIEGGYAFSGYYQMMDGFVYPFTCKVLENDADTVAIALETQYMDSFTIVDRSCADQYARVMLKMAGALKIEEERLLADFSLYDAYRNDEESDVQMRDTFDEEGYLIDFDHRETDTPD